MRYLSYHFAGHGIAARKLNIPLASGTHVHMGLAILLQGGTVESAVEQACGAYWEAAQKVMGSLKTQRDHYLYVCREQVALVEALIRVYALRGLPALRAKYDILGVETEYEFELAPSITFMSRLDGELLNRETGEVEVLSFKTDTGSKLEDKIEDARIDMQGLSEPEAYFRKHGRRPFAVKMEWLVKGQRKTADDGKMYQDSYLVRPWMRPRPGGSGSEWAWSYFWPCPGSKHKILKPDGKTWTCPGTEGATHGLGPSWERVFIGDHMPISEWIEMLATDQVQPGAGDPLEEILYLPESIVRKPAETARTLLQVQAQEQVIAEHEGIANGLDDYFPQYDHSCRHMFGSECQFFDLCWGADQSYLERNEIPEGFEPRQPHHAPELIQLQGAAL